MSLDCRDTALKFLEHRDRSTEEVKSHLKVKGFQRDEIEEQLEYLTELRYLDDERYCRDYIRYSIGKGRGPVRIQQELAEKGVESALVRALLEEHFDRSTEREAALEEAQKLLRWKSTSDDNEESGPDEKTMAKIGRKLNSLGYRSDVIYDVLRKLRSS